MSDVPLPCPFCGEWRGLCPCVIEESATGAYQCPRCGAIGPDVRLHVDEWERVALTRWNDRQKAPLTPLGEMLAKFATEAQNEAKAFSDRGLAEATYILLRRNEMAQQNAAMQK